jgi:Cellulose binding domain
MPGRSSTATRFLAALATAVFVAAAPTPALATEPPGSVTCRYELIAWPGGFMADLFITNNGPTIDGWVVHWTFETPTRVTGVWSSTIYQADPLDAVAVPAPWTRVIPTGRTTAFGWNALAVATEVPTDLTINGVPC